MSSWSDKNCNSNCSVSARVSLPQLITWKLPWEPSPCKLRKSFMRSSDCSSSYWLLISSLKRNGDFEATAEMDWLYVGGCGRNGKFPSCREVSEVDEDDWYKLVQKTEDRENVFWECWTLDPRIFVGEPRDSARMKGDRRADEHSLATKLLPSDSLPKKSCIWDLGVQYDCFTPLEVSLWGTEIISWWLMIVDGSPTFINLSSRWCNIPQFGSGLLQVEIYISRLR